MQVVLDSNTSSDMGPKYNFTSKGAKTLDLGFGSRGFTSKSAAGESLTWEKLKQASQLTYCVTCELNPKRKPSVMKLHFNLLCGT